MDSPEPVPPRPSATGAEDTARSCFHCGLPVPPGLDLRVEIMGREEPMCCYGCQAVARAIIAAGHADYYRYRTGSAPTGRELVPDFIEQTRVYDHPEVQKSFVRVEHGNLREAALIMEGITCAACIWLNERHIAQLPGVVEVQINYATHRAQIRWDESRIRLSEILQAIRAIGYSAHPYDPLQQQAALERERRTHLRRLGVAGVLGMQVMMFSVTLYVGAWSGMETDFRIFFRWIELGLTLPVLLYSAAPFLRGAWRDLRNASIGMDVPVALGILVAFGGSLHATWTGRGEVYYDSVTMFVFFLLVSRYFEMMARRHGADMAERLNQALPAMATRLVTDNGRETHEVVPVAQLEPGDRVLVKPGEVIPADGRLETGSSSVNEALLTGESTPQRKVPGDELIGGSINTESPLSLLVTRVGVETVLAQIMRLLERAQNEKPAITRLADRTAAWFVGGVLLLAALVGLYWWQAAPESWLPIVVSVLVVTCPCALSLATPTAISAATGAMLSSGLLSARGNRLETLAHCTHVVFDKTGTLTRGEPAVTAIHPLSGLDRAEVLGIAAALESQSEHPLGKALARTAAGQYPAVRDLVNHPGAGVSGRIDDTRYFIGNRDFIARHCAQAVESSGLDTLKDLTGITILLSDAQRIHAGIVLHDETRPDARATVMALRQAGKQVILLSGDHLSSVRQVAEEVGIESFCAGMKPQDKLERVQDLQREGAIVAMVGDGINDAPVLAAADVSIAMHGAANISLASADMVLLSEQLGTLAEGLYIARKTMCIVRQNLAWALAYNLVALPAAALGYVAPWMAAIGMSSSSLLVVLNALRLTRRGDRRRQPQPAEPSIRTA
ncbi:MAG: heavy metal translocating P-type ATPase [Gammaproteobacteria bacterium]